MNCQPDGSVHVHGHVHLLMADSRVLRTGAGRQQHQCRNEETDRPVLHSAPEKAGGHTEVRRARFDQPRLDARATLDSEWKGGGDRRRRAWRGQRPERAAGGDRARRRGRRGREHGGAGAIGLMRRDDEHGLRGQVIVSARGARSGEMRGGAGPAHGAMTRRPGHVGRRRRLGHLARNEAAIEDDGRRRQRQREDRGEHPQARHAPIILHGQSGAIDAPPWPSARGPYLLTWIDSMYSTSR